MNWLLAHPLAGDAKVVLHICPFSSFAPGSICDIQGVSILEELKALLQPVTAYGYSPRFTFDGFMLWTRASGSETDAMSTSLLFRNGCIEAIDSNLVRSTALEKSFWEGFIEKTVGAALSRYLKLYHHLGIESPVL